jgi:Ca2+-dependent lipid-binding protein
LQYKKLEFTVWDYDRFKANDFLGQVTIDLKSNVRRKFSNFDYRFVC